MVWSLPACMAINFNHTIVWARDSEASATFLAQILGLPAPKRWGPFQVVKTDNATNLDFINADGEIAPQHNAFLVSETEFDEIFGRVRERSLPYWADPTQTQAGEINYHYLTRFEAAKTDPHSPGKYRVNGVLMNTPGFREAFACKGGHSDGSSHDVPRLVGHHYRSAQLLKPRAFRAPCLLGIISGNSIR